MAKNKTRSVKISLAAHNRLKVAAAMKREHIGALASALILEGLRRRKRGPNSDPAPNARRTPRRAAGPDDTSDSPGP